MILQDDRNARSERGQRQHVARKAKTVHMKDVRGETAEQIAEGRISPMGRLALAERQKIAAHAPSYETLRMRARLDEGDSVAGSAGRFRDVQQSGPCIQKLSGRAFLRVAEEADLYDVQKAARLDRHRLMTRGSQ